MKTSQGTGTKEPRIAVIGGGIFGVTAALVLGERFSVTLYEKNPDILGEATLVNQYRHHHGFHYPRSAETIREVQKSRADFEAFYGSVIYTVPSYYCVAKEGSLVGPEAYEARYRSEGIPFTKEYPPAGYLNRERVSVCFKTPEAVYDYGKLKDFVRARLRALPRVKLRLGCAVTDGTFAGERIRLTGRDAAGVLCAEEFDAVINATYARYNEFCDWFGFSRKPLIFRLKELVVIRATLREKAAVTVMDGPFATVLPTAATSDLFTLGDVPLSVHESETEAGSAAVGEGRFTDYTARGKEIMKRCAQWFPFLTNAAYVESRFVVLPTESASERNDDRHTDVVYHGHGSWSVFSGKIITCVSAAKALLRQLERNLHAS